MKFAVALLLAAAWLPAQAQNQWVLVKSSLTWHITHPVHTAQGTSQEARGKGVCNNGSCDFLIAVPLNTFKSGDTNRDLHMLEIVRGAQYPMVVVRTHMPQSELSQPTIHANLTIQFSGQTVQYKDVPFQRVQQGNDVEIKGTIPATCTDFKITPPEFLMMPIKNEIPVTVDLTWQPAG
ncbi:MAG TPA: YceI family protein [Acidobacteriaceae bacterium]|jgi:hypothetical protein|nr:YceI family protein [Acidobacteriaceae bacterium]